MERDNAWLKNRVEVIWQNHFADIPQSTPILVRWGQRSYRRLGSIMLRKGPEHYISIITISSLLKEPQIPTQIIDQIIAHEIVHYVHGFGSERPRDLKHPHQGGVIVKEFQKRGLWEIYRYYQSWMKINWVKFVRLHLPS
jgi:hypothetical protein